MRALAGLALFAAGACFGQTAFEVAAVKPSARQVSRDDLGPVVVRADRVTGRNVSLPNLIMTAWRVERFQVSGGPRWLDSDNFDMDARAGGPVSREQIGLMLQALLKERFRLLVRAETKEARVYALEVAEHGPRIQPAAGGAPVRASNFHGDMHRFAEFLSIQLSIPPAADPTRPSIATSPVPVVDRTSLAGVYDFHVDFRPEPGVDSFVFWQRILRDQLGLKLEGRKARVEFLVVDRVERTPAAN